MKDEKKMIDPTTEDQEILQLLEMLSQLPEAPVPDEFDLRLRRALKEENAKRGLKSAKTKKAAWKKWTAAAACLLVGFLSLQMLQGGVGADMAMEGGAASGEAVKKMTQNMAVESDEGDAEGYAMVQDEPSVISDITDESGPYEMNMESRLGAGIGIDGEVIQISRGQSSSEEREAFSDDCEQVMTWIAESITENDGIKLAEAMNYKNDLDYSEEDAQMTLKLYRDLFTEEEAELSWKCISLTGWSRSNIYRLTDENRDLIVIISNTPDGLKVTEPILETSQWVYEQIGEQDFTLVEVHCHPEGEEIEFLVELNDTNEELRSFVWKETESL